jgi:hypothetical protein
MTAAAKFLQRATGSGLTETTATTVGGASYTGQIPALDPTTGLLALTMMPTGIGPDTDTSGTCGATALTAGMYVNFYDATGVKSVRPADNTDVTKPAHGFVLAGFTVGNTVTVYMGGLNNLIPVGGFVAADVGKTLYLSTAGGVTITRPTVAAHLDQELGQITNVGATVSSNYLPKFMITVG